MRACTILFDSISWAIYTPVLEPHGCHRRPRPEHVEVAPRRLELSEPTALLVVLELELASVADDDRSRQRGDPVPLGVAVPEASLQIT